MSYESLPRYLTAIPRTATVPHPSARPMVVSAAAALMMLTALLGLGVSAMSMVAVWHFLGVFPANVAVAGATGEVVTGTGNAIRISLTGLAVLTLISAIVISVLALGVLRGNNGARVGTWVLSALGTLCGLAGVCGVIASKSTMSGRGGGSTATAVLRAVQESVPGWFGGAIGGLCGIQALGYIAVAVLLALPAATTFFGAVLRPWRPPAA